MIDELATLIDPVEVLISSVQVSGSYVRIPILIMIGFNIIITLDKKKWPTATTTSFNITEVVQNHKVSTNLCVTGLFRNINEV
ncbi:hypothetical protein BLOT_005865 [Blomia tropicalis]|nr:hypothetical protein BLOT_005865 [Blomia tropicalis]